MSTIRLAHLYPRELNIYADRGNIAVFAQRLAWRGHELQVVEVEVGDGLPTDCNLYYLGGGQDRDQAIVAQDLHASKATLATLVDDGAVLFAVCGGYRLAGHGYTGVDGVRMDGISLLDADTVAGTTRLIGDLVIEVELDGMRRTVVGFENHAGRTQSRVRVPRRSDVWSRATATTARTAAKARSAAVRLAPTCTVRCCPRTRGSRTCCWDGRWSTAPAGASRWTRSMTRWRPPPTPPPWPEHVNPNAELPLGCRRERITLEREDPLAGFAPERVGRVASTRLTPLKKLPDGS